MEEVNDEKILGKYKKIDLTLIITSYLVLAIPIAMLLIFWFKWFVSIPATACLITALVFVVKRVKYKTLEEYKNIFNKKKMSIIVVLLLGLNLLSGAGGIFFQNWDYRGRNAILHDLIDYDWPVKYDYAEQEYEANRIGAEKGFLSYYFAYWLPAAAIGKIMGFKVANLFLLLWQMLSTILFFYLLCRKLNKTNLKYFLVFICFGRTGHYYQINNEYLEW